MEETMVANTTETQAATAANPTARKKEVFAALTGLRAVAAYMVFFHHFPIRSLIVPGFDLQREMHIGVPLFFVLSGFLICYRYFDNISWKFSWFRTYFKNRFARIYPVYFVLCVGSFVAGRYWGVKNAILNLTLTHAFFPDVKRVISPSWSLTVEECFYASAPFIFFFGKKKLIIPYLFFSALLLGILYGNDSFSDSSGFLGDDHFVLLFTFFGRFSEFFIGILLGILVLNKKLKPAVNGAWSTTVGIAGVIAVLIALAVSKPVGVAYGVDTTWGIILNNLVLPVFVAILLYGLMAEKTMVGKWLSLPFMNLLGKSSYAFYLVHKSFLFGYAAMAAALLHMPEILFCFISLNVFCILLYKYYEHPMNEWIRKW